MSTVTGFWPWSGAARRPAALASALLITASGFFAAPAALAQPASEPIWGEGAITGAVTLPAVVPQTEGTVGFTTLPALWNSGEVKLKGSSEVGETLVATLTNFNPKPDRYEYQWLRDGNPITHATDAKYKLTAKDTGHEVRVKVTAVHKNSKNVVVKSSAKLVRAAESVNCGAVNGFSIDIVKGKTDCKGALAISKAYTKAWQDDSASLGSGAFFEKGDWNCSRNYTSDAAIAAESDGLVCDNGKTEVHLTYNN